MSTAISLQRNTLPAPGSPYYYHRQNKNVSAINEILGSANLSDEQKQVLVSNIAELVKNSVRDGLDQTGV